MGSLSCVLRNQTALTGTGTVDQDQGSQGQAAVHQLVKARAVNLMQQILGPVQRHERGDVRRAAAELVSS